MSDDPYRTADRGTLPGERDWSAAEEAKYLIDLTEAQERHYRRVRPLVMATLAGELPRCPGLHNGRIQPLDSDDLYEIITTDCEAGILGRVLVGQTECGLALIDAYCEELAEFVSQGGMAMSTEVIAAMDRYGGGFVSNLGALWLIADDANRAILETAFADIFTEYGEVAARETT